jgi:prepilin-type processing-associated H-X9-DG protein
MDIKGQPETPKKGPSILVRVLSVLIVLAVVGIVFFVAIVVPSLREAKNRANTAKCNVMLKMLALAAVQYADTNRYFPYDASDPTGRKSIESLKQYCDDPDCFRCPLCPEGDFSYEGFVLPKLTPNASSDTPIVWDAKPHPDGTRNVAFLDGHTISVDPAGFDEMKAALAKRAQATR